jgi:hypothetical protein
MAGLSWIDFVIMNRRHHLAMFRPVMGWLRDQGEFRLRVLSFCELRGVPTPLEDIERAGGEAGKCLPVSLSKNWRPAREVGDNFEGRPRRWLHSLAWHALFRWSLFEQESRPSLVVLPNDVAFPNYRIVRRLREDRIPFLLMQEGIRFEQPRRPPGRQYGQGGATAVAAWGSSSARYFERVGVPSDRLHLVGNPRLDELAHRDWAKAARPIAEEIDVDRETLLFVSNPIDNQGLCSTREKYRLFTDFLRAGRPFFEATSYQLIVKLHAGDSLRDYRALIAQESDPDRVKLVSDTPLYPLIHLSRGVVVMASTAGLEAMLMDRPLGVLPVPGAGYIYDYVESGAALGIDLNAHLAEQLDELISDHCANRQRRHAYIQDQIVNFGNATEAVGELMLQLVDHQKSRVSRK